MAGYVYNPYTGKTEETCSVSFTAQQQMAAGVGSPQTEAEYSASKLLGEIGVMKGKKFAGTLPDDVKLLTFESKDGSRGYFILKNGKLKRITYINGVKHEYDGFFATMESMVKSGNHKVSIPQAVSPKPDPEPVVVHFGDPGFNSSIKETKPDGYVVAVSNTGQSYIKVNKTTNKFELWSVDDNTGQPVLWQESPSLAAVMQPSITWHKPDGKDHTPNATTKTDTPPPAPSQVAAPTPASPVDASSNSVGSMSHEDVAAMFVKIKDDLAKEKGLNIKGANAALDEEVYKAIGNVTGYTPAEVKAKIDAYKADGNKLSALKKKVMAGNKKVPTGNTAQQPSNAPKPLVPSEATPKPDPKPHGVPTVATQSATNAAKQEVKDEAEANPTKVYSDEDVAAAYIIAKDKVVAESGGKWTLYSKNDELDLQIAIQVGLKTGLNPNQQKQAIANYLASGKKLSTLKKQLAKQGAFKPQADTLKKSGAAKTQAEKDKEAEEKAEAQYTPVGTPATGNPPIDTGSPMPKSAAEKAKEAGDISDIPTTKQTDIYAVFKSQGSKAYLSSSNEQTYEALYKVQKSYPDYSLLQIIRVIDATGAKKFNAENGFLFEKKTVKWLTSPEGTKFIKDKEEEFAKQAEKEAAAAKAKAEAEKLAKELQDKQPALPADSAQYPPWELEKAKRISATWLSDNPWDAKQKRDLTHYTSNAYVEMNKYLRGISSTISDRSKAAIDGTRAGMRPTTEPIMVRRGSGADQFISLGVGRGQTHLLWGLTGKTFQDKGFLSTSAGGQAAFGGEVKLEIECPIGTPMAYVAPISRYPHENEMLLQSGLEYEVLQVRKEGGQFVVRMRVVNWPGKAS